VKASRNKTVPAWIRNYPACGRYSNVCWVIFDLEYVTYDQLLNKIN